MQIWPCPFDNRGMVINAAAIVESLNAAELRQRIEANKAEREALLVLLRAAQAKERAKSASRQSSPRKPSAETGA